MAGWVERQHVCIPEIAEDFTLLWSSVQTMRAELAANGAITQAQWAAARTLHATVVQAVRAILFEEAVLMMKLPKRYATPLGRGAGLHQSQISSRAARGHHRIREAPASGLQRSC